MPKLSLPESPLATNSVLMVRNHGTPAWDDFAGWDVHLPEILNERKCLGLRKKWELRVGVSSKGAIIQSRKTMQLCLKASAFDLRGLSDFRSCVDLWVLVFILKKTCIKGRNLSGKEHFWSKAYLMWVRGQQTFFCKGGVVSFFGFGHQRPLQPRLPLLVNAETATDDAETNGLALCQHDRQK